LTVHGHEWHGKPEYERKFNPEVLASGKPRQVMVRDRTDNNLRKEVSGHVNQNQLNNMKYIFPNTLF